MATISDLPIKDLRSLSDEELLSLIRGVRGRRRDTSSEAHQEAKKKAQAKAKKGKAVALQSVDSLLKGVSPALAKQLLSQLNQIQQPKGEN